MEECVMRIPSGALRHQTWEGFILQHDHSRIMDDSVRTVLVVSPFQFIAFHAETLPLIRFSVSQPNCVLRCQCSDAICGILRDLIISKMREEGVPETAAQFFVEWVLGTIIITS